MDNGYSISWQSSGSQLHDRRTIIVQTAGTKHRNFPPCYVTGK